MENNKQEEKKETLTKIDPREAQSLDQASRQPQNSSLDTQKHTSLIRTMKFRLKGTLFHKGF